MHVMGRTLVALAIAMGVSGCATTAPSPVEVTRFHDASMRERLGHGTIFIEAAPASEGDETLSGELSLYKAAIAEELEALGYEESARGEAEQIAQLRLERYRITREGERSGPVSVGVAGSTGSYGSGIGLGIGINLGAGKEANRIGTTLSVMIRDRESGNSLWEGRARIEAPRKSPLAAGPANAHALARALFSGFPGNNGETIEIEVKE